VPISSKNQEALTFYEIHHMEQTHTRRSHTYIGGGVGSTSEGLRAVARVAPLVTPALAPGGSGSEADAPTLGAAPCLAATRDLATSSIHASFASSSVCFALRTS